MLRSWYQFSGKNVASQARYREVYVKICYLLDGGKLDAFPQGRRDDLDVDEIMKRNDFAIKRWTITDEMIQSHFDNRRSPLNLSPFFIWRDEKNVANVEFRLLSNDQMIHPLAFDLPAADDIITSTNTDQLPLDIIAYHSFSQLLINSGTQPIKMTLSMRLRCHAKISGRQVTEEYIRNKHAKDVAPWFYSSIPFHWKNVIQKHKRFSEIYLYEQIKSEFEVNIKNQAEAPAIASIMGCDTVAVAIDFLQHVITAIVEARIKANCHGEILLFVNPIIGYLMDHLQYLEHAIQEIDPSLSGVLKKIISKINGDEDDQKATEEMETDGNDDDDTLARDHWLRKNEARYQCIQTLAPCHFLDAIPQNDRQQDITDVCCVFV